MQTDRSWSPFRCNIERVIGIPRECPMVDPGQTTAISEAGFPKRAAAALLLETKSLARDVRDGEVRELQVVDDKTGSVWITLGGRPNALPEKGQFVTEAMVVIVGQIAGEVPPFGFEFAVHVMVPRELILPARLCFLPIGS